jgi:hypothetical protein
MEVWGYVPAAGPVNTLFGWAFCSELLELRTALILQGPSFGYPAVVDAHNSPRIFGQPASSTASVTISSARRLEQPDIVRPVNQGPGAPSILLSR